MGPEHLGFFSLHQEGANINKSLTTLGKVISALAEMVGSWITDQRWHCRGMGSTQQGWAQHQGMGRPGTYMGQADDTSQAVPMGTCASHFLPGGRGAVVGAKAENSSLKVFLLSLQDSGPNKVGTLARLGRRVCFFSTGEWECVADGLGLRLCPDPSHTSEG